MENKKELFQPYTSARLSLKNRFMVAPMSRVSAIRQGLVTDAMVDYYAAFAKGGFGAIITEGVYTDRIASRGYFNQPGITDEAQMLAWKKAVQQVEKQDTLFICQLMHAGALSQSLEKTLAPSAVKPLGKQMCAYGVSGEEFPAPHQMDPEDINEAISGFANAANLASRAGFDGVEIHAANGYLLDQFLTDYTNQRTDQYGGSMENRFRIIREIFTRIRRVVPGDFTIGLRLSEGKVNNLRFRWKEGSDKARQVLLEAKKLKPSYIHIAAESGNWERDCMYDDGTSFTGLAREIVQVPVIANGGLHDLSTSGKLIAQGHGDLIAIGKAALADPSWLAKTARGEEAIAFHPDMIRHDASLKTSEVIRA